MTTSLQAVIEVLDRDGHVRAVHKVQQWPTRIGRSPGCDVVLDDGHVAAEHAELLLNDEGQPALRLLPSLNGGWLADRRLQGGDEAALRGPALFQLGSTQLRWRTAADAMAAELPMLAHQQRRPKRHASWLPVLLLLFVAMLGGEQWLSLNPGSLWVEYAGAVLTPVGIVLAWAAVWALVTQLFQHRFPFATHLRRVLVGITAIQLMSWTLGLLAFSLSLPLLVAMDALIVPAAAAALLWWHASLVWPRAKRTLALVLAGLVIGGLLLTAARRQEQQHWFGPSYISVLAPPALRLAAPKPVDALIDELRPLQAELARQAAKDNDQPSVDDD
jgi:hypothetical protein